MSKKIINHEDDKIIYLIAKGIIIVYEKSDSNFTVLPRELKRAINILGAKYNIIIKDRGNMVELFSKPIEEWLSQNSIYGSERFIEDGIPTDFCYEMSIDTNDIEGELDQVNILNIKNYFKINGKEEDYTKFRSFLIKNPISTKEKLEEFILKNSKYDSELKKGYAQIYEFYEDIPQHYIINNMIEVCNYCGWTIVNKRNEKHCISDYCKANMGVEKSKSTKYCNNLVRVKRGVMRYISLPGIPELSLKEKLTKLGLEVILYPNFDEYDIEVNFKYSRWAIDIKDYGNPYSLVRNVKSFAANSCSKSFIVIPNKRYSLNKDYKYIMKAEEPINFEYIVERDFIKKLRRR